MIVLKKIIYVIIFFIFCIGFTNFVYSKPLKKQNAENEPCKFYIYNSHPYEKYSYGEDIKAFSKRLNNRLIKIGVESTFIDYTESMRSKSYSGVRKLLAEKVKNFDNSSLIDVHVNGNGEIYKSDIKIYIAKGNLNYKKNEEFAKKLVSSIRSLNKNISVDIIAQKNVKYNQDLSDKAILIVLNSNIEKDDLNKIIDTLAFSIKKM